MSGLLENIGSIITSVIGWLGQIASALIQNPIFAVLMAVILFKLLYELINKIITIINIEKMPYYNLDNDDYQDWKENYSQNAKDMEQEEEDDFLDSIM